MTNRKSEFTTIHRLNDMGDGAYQVNLMAHVSDSFPFGVPLLYRMRTYAKAESLADYVDTFMQEYKSEIIAEYKEENESKT